MVLQDEAAGGAGDCGGGTRGNPHGAGKPAGRIFQLDEEHPGLDVVAATVVGASDSGVVLRGAPTHHGGTRGAGEVRNVRLNKIDARSGRFGYLVQLGALAV